jgi:hypothetical protein
VTETPPVRRRLLGAALREYRETLGYKLDEAARILECEHYHALVSPADSTRAIVDDD